MSDKPNENSAASAPAPSFKADSTPRASATSATSEGNSMPSSPRINRSGLSATQASRLQSPSAAGVIRHISNMLQTVKSVGEKSTGSNNDNQRQCLDEHSNNSVPAAAETPPMPATRNSSNSGSRRSTPGAGSGSRRGTPTPTSKQSHQGRPLLLMSSAMGGTDSPASGSDSGVLCLPAHEASENGSAATPASTSAFAYYNASRVVSNRGEYVRHCRIGAGAFGQTWIVEWRPVPLTSRNCSRSGSIRGKRSVAEPNIFSSGSNVDNNNSGAGPPSPPDSASAPPFVNNPLVRSTSLLAENVPPHVAAMAASVTSPRAAAAAAAAAAAVAGAVATAATAAQPFDPDASGASSNVHVSSPPALVSGLSCSKPFLEIRPGLRVQRERLFVLKTESKCPSEQREAAVAKSPSGYVKTSTAATVDGKCAVVLVPRQDDMDDREHAAFESEEEEDEHNKALHSALDKLMRQGAYASASDLELALPAAGEGALSLHTSSSNNTFGGASSSGNDESLSVDLQRRRQSSPTGTPSSLNVRNVQRTGGVQTLQRREVQNALREHATVSHEGRVLRNCAHPNIVGFVDEFEDETNRYLVMEYVDGGDLRREVERRATLELRAAISGTRNSDSNHLSASFAMFPWVQALCAVEYLHRHNILHQDIKTANLLVSKKWRVLLADFGFGRNYSQDVDILAAATAAQGTPHYMAPELFARGTLSAKVDIWALGVVLFELLALRRPFEQGNDTVDGIASRAINQQHLSVNRFRPAHLQVPPEVVGLIDAMLQKDPKQRPTAKQLMRMPFVNAALDDYKNRLSAAAQQSGLAVDTRLVSVLEEHIKLVRSDDLPSGESRRRQAELRRARLAGRQTESAAARGKSPSQRHIVGAAQDAAASLPTKRTEKRKPTSED